MSLPTASEELLPTGVRGLDEILLGGVTKYNNILVEGPPGAGKTTLGLQFIHAGAAQNNSPGIIISFELDERKILRDASGFNLDLAGLRAQGLIKIIQTTPEILLSELRKPSGVLIEEIQKMDARRLLVDGLAPLKIFADRQGRSFREDLYLIVETLSRLGVTTMTTAERSSGDDHESRDERFVFDTVIRLDFTTLRRTSSRTIQISKSRGQRFVDGIHTMRIESGRGVMIYRRAYSRPTLVEKQPTSNQRISTGIEELDGIMGGGVYRGSLTMIAGISGTGKTVAGVQFLLACVAAGMKTLLVTLDEHPQQLVRNARSLNMGLEEAVSSGQLLIYYESPLELESDVHFERVRSIVEREAIQAVVFDSAAAYATTYPGEVTDFLYALGDYLKERLITSFLAYETPELLGISQISEAIKASHLVDNIILLNYVEISTRLRRAIVVPKVRGSENIQVTREYAIGQGGIRILADESMPDGSGAVPQLPFSTYYGLLARSPSRRSPLIEEAIQTGSELPQSQPEEGRDDRCEPKASSADAQSPVGRDELGSS